MSNINASTQQWVPVVNASGSSVEASLKDIFNTSSGLSSLAEDAWSNLAYLDLLVAVSTAACRPKDNEEVLSYLGDRGSFCSKVQQYLDQWVDGFWLHHPTKPLFQVACMTKDYPGVGGKGYTYRQTSDLSTEGAKTAQVRSPVAGSDTATPGGILRLLLKSQKVGGNLKYGVSTPAGPKLIPSGQVQAFQTGIPEMTSTNGGSTSTQNFRVEGADLLETIMLNMIPEDKVTPTWVTHGLGRPSWEYNWDDHSKILAREGEHTASFLGRMVPMRKFLWVDPGDASRMLYASAEGLDYQAPLQVLKMAKQSDGGYYLAPRGLDDPKVKAVLGTVSEEIPLWKEFAALKGVRELPQVLSKFIGYQGDIRCISVGMQVSGSMGLVYHERCVVSTTEWPAGTFSAYITELGGSLEAMVKSADDTGKKIWGAVSRYHREMNIDPKGKVADQNLAEVRFMFWEALGMEYPGYLRRLGTAGLTQEWEAMCRESAKYAVHTALKGLGARRNKAVALAVGQLK